MSASRVASASIRASSSRSNSASNSDDTNKSPELFTSLTLRWKALKSGVFIVNSANRRIVDPILHKFILRHNAYILPERPHLFERDPPGYVYDINTLYDWFFKIRNNTIPHTNEALTASELDRLKINIQNAYVTFHNIRGLLRIHRRLFSEAFYPFHQFVNDYDWARAEPRQASALLERNTIRQLVAAQLLPKSYL